jgi:hypothetical protein
MTRTEALAYAAKYAGYVNDGFFGDVPADELGSGVWDYCLEQGADQGDACEAVEEYYRLTGVTV